MNFIFESRVNEEKKVFRFLRKDESNAIVGGKIIRSLMEKNK